MLQQKPEVQFDDFAKLDMRAGTITECTPMEGSDKLLKLIVDFGELGRKQILSGIAQWFSPEDLVKVQTIFVLNITPRKMMGELSEGMLMAIGEDEAILLKPTRKVENGAVLL